MLKTRTANKAHQIRVIYLCVIAPSSSLVPVLSSQSSLTLNIQTLVSFPAISCSLFKLLLQVTGKLCCFEVLSVLWTGSFTKVPSMRMTWNLLMTLISLVVSNSVDLFVAELGRKKEIGVLVTGITWYFWKLWKRCFNFSFKLYKK